MQAKALHLSSAPGNNSAELSRLIRQMLAEPFAVNRNLSTLTLDASGKIFEEAEVFFSSMDPSDPMRTSYERCKEIYLTALMLLETGGSSHAQWTLGQWLLAPPVVKAAPIPIAAEPATSNPDSEVRFLSSLANEIYQLSKWFASQATSNSGRPEPRQMLRLQVQHLCLATEVEVEDRLQIVLDRVWKDRESLFAPLFERKTASIELHPSAQMRITGLAERYPQWLPDGKFPFAPFFNAMRYCHTLTGAEHFHPSLLESAMFLLLFGLPRGQSIGSPVLETKGIPEEHVVELAFRLIRMQKSRNHTLSPYQSTDRVLVETTLLDMRKAIFLLAKIKVGKGS
jgi:hypothetical protein